MIFDFWKKKTEKDSVDNNVIPLYNYPSYEETNNPGKIPPMPTVVPPAPKEDKCYYTVGTTQSGKTVLRMCDESGYSSLSLTMNEAATRQMIRMLEATLTEEDDDVEADPISN